MSKKRKPLREQIATLAGEGPQTARDSAPTEPQTAGLVHRQREIAGHPARGIRPLDLNRILEEAERGDIVRQHELAMDMEERDGHLFAELSKRRQAIGRLSWAVEPPRTPSAAERANADYCAEQLAKLPMAQILLDASDGLLHGFAALELPWERAGREWLPGVPQHRPQTWFRLDQATHSELRLRDDSPDGAELWPLGWIVHRHRARPGYIARSGLLRQLCWPYLFKHFGIDDLTELLEIYGLPIKIGTYPGNATEKQKITLKSALRDIGHNAAGIIPEGMKIDFQRAAEGAAEPFESLIGWCERTESKVLLGGTLTSDAQGGTKTNALGNVHEAALWDLVCSDALQYQTTIGSQLLAPICMLNRGLDDPRRAPRLVFDTAEEGDFELMSKALPPLVGLGMQIPVAWAHDRLKVPRADGQEPMLSSRAPAPVDQPPAPLAALSARLPASVPDTPERIAARLRDEAQAGMDRLLATLGDPPAGITTLSAYRDWLDAQLGGGTLPAPEFAEAMRRALVLGHLAGRFDVMQETNR